MSFIEETDHVHVYPKTASEMHVQIAETNEDLYRKSYPDWTRTFTVTSGLEHTDWRVIDK